MFEMTVFMMMMAFRLKRSITTTIADVECGFDGGTWRGASAPLIGVDCSPNDSNVYPNAESICDGQYNDCSSWVERYADDEGDCFCTSDSCDPEASGGILLRR